MTTASKPEPRRAYPLTWPTGRIRTPPKRRTDAKFKMSFEEAWNSLLDELECKMDAGSVIVSTNVPIASNKKTTLPMASHAKLVVDPGVAVYFERKGRAYALACDAYSEVRWNLRAVAVTIKALRDIERHGATAMLEQAFSGFLALPAPGEQFDPKFDPPWHEVLGIDPNASGHDVEVAYKALARKLHPDAGGDNEAFLRLGRARMAAEQSVAQRAHVEMRVGVNSRIA